MYRNGRREWAKNRVKPIGEATTRLGDSQQEEKENGTDGIQRTEQEPTPKWRDAGRAKNNNHRIRADQARGRTPRNESGQTKSSPGAAAREEEELN